MFSTKFRVIWTSSFRGEDSNVKTDNERQMPRDGKSSQDLLAGKLIILTANKHYQCRVLKYKFVSMSLKT